jgi:hypothetical protein
MNGVSRMRIPAAATLAAVALHALPSAACGFHGSMVDLVAAHPRSIEVAFSVRDAFVRKDLAELAAVPPALGFLRATRTLQDFSELVTSVAGEKSSTIAVLLIEPGLWTRYSVTPQGVTAEVHVAGALEQEPVIVTSESALRAMIDGTLSPQRAVEMGVLKVIRPA